MPQEFLDSDQVGPALHEPCRKRMSEIVKLSLYRCTGLAQRSAESRLAETLRPYEPAVSLFGHDECFEFVHACGVLGVGEGKNFVLEASGHSGNGGESFL